LAGFQSAVAPPRSLDVPDQGIFHPVYFWKALRGNAKIKTVKVI
jgi:hypothetical protein